MNGRREFCTLFDSVYLPRGLVLHASLERVCPSYRLWIFCMDDRTEADLVQLALRNVEIVPLASLEAHDPALLAVKEERNADEYCWTATPSVCLYVLDADPVIDEITYLDADIRFFSDPEALFREIGDASTTIVPHRYAPHHRAAEEPYGTYNVEWLTFRRDADGLEALHWWHDRCIEWCYRRVEEGRWGDQKYLDDWPTRFKQVHVLEHPGGGLAPWNVAAHRLEESGGSVLVDGDPLVFYHYHSLRLFRRDAAGRVATVMRELRRPAPGGTLLWTTQYPVSPDERRLIWETYLCEFEDAVDRAHSIDVDLVGGVGAWRARDTARHIALHVRHRAVSARSGLRLAVGPARWMPNRATRYRDSWKSSKVAQQMLELTERELADPASSNRAFLEMLPLLESMPILLRPARFLDIGCGVGGYGELLERHASSRFEYVGADYASEILAAARERWPGRRFVQIDLFEPGALDGHDVIFASALIDILPDPALGLGALFSADASCVILHRQRIADDGPRVEIVSGYRGQTTYRSTMSFAGVERIAAGHGRRIAARVPVDEGIESFLVVREEPA